MANSDVKVKEIRLLESYSNAYSRFIEATIALSYRFMNNFRRKDEKAHECVNRIKTYRETIQQRLKQAQNEVEASLRRGGGMDGQELANRELVLRKFQTLNQKAQEYEESSKKIYQNIHSQTDRMVEQSNIFRRRLEQSKEEGANFLNRAISALNSYTQ